MNQVPEYEKIKSLKSKIDKAKKEYLLGLIELGYVFEQKGSYEDKAYWATHKSYYKTDDEIWNSDEFVMDGKISPDYYPKGAFMRIDSLVENETEDPWETDYLLSEDRCYLDYLN